ncbi:D-alanyl-D-alanine carboxypeptidase family protein [Neptunomonas sp. XY-337]|uniref:D-alanyl-D-alanine carboxypeptidase family protein n=1 Tax=Neptunomonas sp. XY-337 TaxID=2561897 RepID=UPI0010AB09DC|nr:D-alanyl-D-alanine carboxypeptidase family protein [Neptunomonas sp. XY-337]
MTWLCNLVVKSVWLALLLFVSLRVAADSVGEMSSIVIDADSGAVLSEVKADVPWYPASLTKLMTLYVTFQSLERGDIRLSDKMRVSGNAANQPPKKLGVSIGDTLTVEQAIKAVSTISANDVSVALAEFVAGSEKQFVGRMNAQAKAMQMDETFFVNPHGWPDKAQLTSARDMAILARQLLVRYPDYYHYLSSPSFYYEGQSYTSHNRFVFSYDGADGMKTGYTCSSGYNLVASAVRGGDRLIGVVMGAASLDQRYEYAVEVMDAGFEKGVDAPGLRLLSWRGSRALSLRAPQVKFGDGCINLSQQ